MPARITNSHIAPKLCIGKFEGHQRTCVCDLNRAAVKNLPRVRHLWREEHNDVFRDVRREFYNGDFFTAHIMGEIVGMGGLSRADAKTAIIRKVRVHPEFRKKGVISAVISHLEETARGEKFQWLRMRVIDDNIAMQRLLERNGFMHMETENTGSHLLVFEKWLMDSGRPR